MTRKAVIYARVSSAGDRQSTDRQVVDLTRAAGGMGYEVAETFTEKMSGAVAGRPVLTECLEYCVKRKVDCLMVSEVSRLGRGLKIIVDTLDMLTSAGIDVFIQNLGIHTLDEEKKKNPFGTLLISVMGACAEIERDNIRDRLRSGRELAKERGIRLGRKEGYRKTREAKAEEYAKVLRLLRRGESVRNTAKLCDVSVSTVQRIKKEFEL
jgi:DNA invertase Pin-like site-specific DNA recombinase